MTWRVSCSVVLIAMGLAACRKGDDVKSARQIFEDELNQRHVRFTVEKETGFYRMTHQGIKMSVSLENFARNYERDKDPKAVVDFIDKVLEPRSVPDWNTAKSFVYFSAEPSDQPFGNTIRTKVSNSISRVLVVTDLDEGTITWITPSKLSKWGVTETQVEVAALKNMDTLLEGKKIEVMMIEDMKIGMIPVESSFKASVIFAPSFKRFISTELQWPVLVVIPCRDFIYVISEKDKSLLNRMGRVVVNEYNRSGYPISTEVLRISDQGIEAIGEFPKAGAQVTAGTDATE